MSEINNFVSFLKKNDIMQAAVATIFSRMISDLCYSFIDNIFLPIFNIDLNDDGKPDLNSIINTKISIFGCKIKLGLFLLEMLKFITILFILYFISQL